MIGFFFSVRVSMSVTIVTLIKENISLDGQEFRGVQAIAIMAGHSGSVQTDVVPQRQLKILSCAGNRK